MNNKYFIGLLLLLLSGLVTAQEIDFSPDDWENPAIFEKGQVAPHAFFVPFSSAASALKNEPANCENYQLLNGQWKFKWGETPAQVRAGFWQPDYDASSWDNITVPANWQMEGYGYPKFRNIMLSFESDPPNIPDYFNPVGCYKRSIIIPRNWKNKEIILRFEGIKSAAYIWVNGKRVGYNQGGFEPAEFNITSFVKTGKNDLSIQVIRFCDGSYLENQDMWRLSGIYRDVKLYAQPKTYIHDYYLMTDLDENYEDATLNLEVDVQNQDNKATEVSIEYTLFSEDGQNRVGATPPVEKVMIDAKATKKVKLSTFVKNPEKWTAETPNLYTLLIQLKDRRGRILEAFSQKMGFREIEYKNNILTVNGVPIKLNGMNSHMHDPDHGQAVPLETLRKDLVTMKQFNMNCVRTSHYPPTPEYIAMADEIGMYIVDEVGDEAHNNTQLSEDPAWTEMYKDRSRKLVYRDRNHPSVLMWSAGNESGSGENIKAVIETGKAIDPSRPAWMYGGNKFYIPFEDIVGPRYWLPLWLRNLVNGQILPEGDNRSSFMDEYLAATGNSLGGLDEYWEIIRNNERSMGGAIWDYVSPGISTPRWIVPDQSIMGNDGQVMGRPQFVDGKNGRGLQLSGHDDWVEFYRDPSLDITGKELSIGFWVKPFEIPQANVFLAKGKSQYGIQMSDPETLEFWVTSITRGFPAADTKRISVQAEVGNDFYGKWHYIAGIYSSDRLLLYLDDRLVGVTEFDGEMVSTPFPLCIGRESETQDQGEYAGRMSSLVIDDLKIYDKAVPLAELKTKTQEAMLALDFEQDEKGEDFYAIGLGGRTYGVIWPNREVQPEIHQIKKSGQPIGFTMLEDKEGSIKITNYHHFKNLNELNGTWALTSDGEVIQRGELALDVPAQESKEIKIAYQSVNRSGELILLLSYQLKEATIWAEAGHEIAWEQFVLPSRQLSINLPGNESRLLISDEEEVLQVKGADFTYTINKTTGQLKSLMYKGSEYLEGSPAFNIWRAPLSNDIDPWGSYRYYSKNTIAGAGRSIDNQLRTLGLRDLVHEADQVEVLTAEKGKVVVSVKAWSMSSLPKGGIQNFGRKYSAFQRNEIWTFYADGSIELKQEIRPHGPMPEILPKEGLQFKLPASFNQVEWYGRGPFETYSDRKTGAKIGVYQSDVDAMYEPYIIPQDYGNRSDVRWLKVKNAEGKGLMISAENPLNFSLHKYTTDNLSRAMYTYQLAAADHTILNLDYRVSGVGGTALRQLQAYRNAAGVNTYKLRIKPF